MALETGGRMTKGVNDPALAYARARRDLGCRYTLGFYEDDPRIERAHGVHVKLNRPGLRVASPSRYAFRSEERKRESILTAAYIAPDMFENGVIRAHVFPVRPVDRRSWECTVAVEFPVPFSEKSGGVVEREFGVVVRSSSGIAASFNRRISVRYRNAQSTTRRVSFSQPVLLSPGDYTVIAVMTASGMPRPYTASVRAVIPGVPDEAGFVVAPLLGRRAADNVAVQAGTFAGDGSSSGEVSRLDHVLDAGSFMPLLVNVIGREEDLLGQTHVCFNRPAAAEATVIRNLQRDSGQPVLTLPPSGFTPSADRTPFCDTLVDDLPVASLQPGRYGFGAVLQQHGEKVSISPFVAFTIQEESANPPDTLSAGPPREPR